MKESEAIKLVAILRGAYPMISFDEATGDVYALMLEDLEARAAGAAVTRLIGTSRWLPTIAEIRREALASRNETPPELAWSLVLAEVSRVGVYGTPIFESPLVAAAVDAVGWRAICASTMIAAERSRFIDAYRVSLDAHERGRVLRSLPGARAEQAVTISETIPRLLEFPKQSDKCDSCGSWLETCQCPGKAP